MNNTLYTECETLYIVIYPICGDRFEVVIKGNKDTDIQGVVMTMSLKSFGPVEASQLVETVHEAERYMDKING